MNVLSADLGEIRDSSARSGRSNQWAAARVTTAKVSDDVLHVPRPMCGVWPVRARECAL
jgi:hypothetical protein